MINKTLQKKILAASDEILPSAWKLAKAIFDKPELAYLEFEAAKALEGFLKEEGFSVETNIADIPTAFRAKQGKGKPVLAFLAEMDALKGMGHACGHHLIAASSAAAATVLTRSFDRLPGTVEVIGTPAEEGGGGKVVMAEAGVFDSIDAAMIAHPDRRTEIYKRSLGVVELEVVFTGRAAHAAAYPEDGINALDAVIQTFNAVAMLRQQLPEKVRVHGIISDGGQAPNIIPEQAAARFYARGLTVEETLRIAEKVRDCAKGAAKATGCKLGSKLVKKHMYAPYVPNRALAGEFEKYLEILGEKVDNGPEDEGMGSTDVGNVCLRAPVIHPLMALPGVVYGVHTTDFAKAAGSDPGKKMLAVAIKALAMTGASFLTDPELRKKVAKEHKEKAGR